MPELPEVETIRKDLSKHLPGRVFLKTDVIDARVLAGSGTEDFLARMKNRTVAAVDRRAKAIIISFLEGGHLVVHPRMTGQLIIVENAGRPAPLKATKVVFHLSQGLILHYNDQRLFGRLQFARELNEVRYFRNLGPEPLSKDFSASWLFGKLKERSISIKPLLLNQHFVAGVGNIYASEILFNAGIRPTRRACALNKKEADALYGSVVSVLEEAVKLRGTSMRNYRDGFGGKGGFRDRIRVYGRETRPCPRCRTPIKKIVQNGRSTFYCNVCQH